jgi:hypothetical protein
VPPLPSSRLTPNSVELSGVPTSRISTREHSTRPGTCPLAGLIHKQAIITSSSLSTRIA